MMCEYCSGEENLANLKLADPKQNLYLWIEGNELWIESDTYNQYSIAHKTNIKYCPMCGVKLEVE